MWGAGTYIEKVYWNAANNQCFLDFSYCDVYGTRDMCVPMCDIRAVIFASAADSKRCKYLFSGWEQMAVVGASFPPSLVPILTRLF